MSIETAVLIGRKGEPIYWHEPPGRSAAHLPDSADLWSVIWANRDNLNAIVHSHPGTGVPWASTTDLTTFAAIERALGRPLQWWILTQDHVAIWRYANDPTDYVYYPELIQQFSDPGMLPACLTELYHRSYTNA